MSSPKCICIYHLHSNIFIPQFSLKVIFLRSHASGVIHIFTTPPSTSDYFICPTHSSRTDRLDEVLALPRCQNGHRLKTSHQTSMDLIDFNRSAFEPPVPAAVTNRVFSATEVCRCDRGHRITTLRDSCVEHNGVLQLSATPILL